MKKLCFMCYDMTVTGGVEQVTVSLANAFCDEYKVYIFSMFGRDKKTPYQLSEKITYHAEMEKECRLRERIKSLFRPFKSFINDNDIDIVLTMENYPALAVSPVRFFTKAKFIFCDHGAIENEWANKEVTFFRFWNALYSHKTVTLTQQNKEDYTKKLHIPEKKVISIYNWIGEQILKCRKEYDSKSKKIISVGRFSPEKGQDMLVEVAQKVLTLHSDWEWHVYGDGDTFSEIAEKITAYQLDKQVFLKGTTSQVYEKYSGYAVFVLTSYREGLPLVLLEAKACGLPMVSFDILTGPSEIIEDNRDGYLIPPYNIEQMAQKLDELIQDEEKRKEFSKNTTHNLWKFEKSEIYNQWIELFESFKK